MNSAQRQPPVTDTTSTTARAATQPNTASTADTASNAAGDTINLSPAAQVGAAAYTASATLNDKDAVSTSVGLRQSIGGASLSVSAKQNQAILSLLR
ncbi:MAG TPA: hypothetical protein VKQ29_16290 [Aliidongia sp.]|nr:hypothetical protein [Aliidongia sp.]